MAYSLYTASFGAGNANANVRISETSTGKLAIILASPTGGLVNDRGQATLDASGNLSVYIDTARFWTVFINDVDKPDVYMDFSPKYVYAGTLAGAPAASGYTKGEKIIVTDDSWTERTSNGVIWIGQTAAEIARVSGLPEVLGGTRSMAVTDNQGVFTQAGSATVTLQFGIGPSGLQGFSIWLTAAGTITIQAGAGVTLNGTLAGSYTMNNIYKPVIVQHLGSNVFAAI